VNHFFALELSPDARKEAAQAAREWWELFNPRASWLVAEDYHITLKVLGEVSEVQLSYLTKAASHIAGQTTPFRVGLASFGAFPDFRLPRYLWIGVKPALELDELAGSLSRLAEREQVPSDQWPYTPHVTVAHSLVTGSGLRWPVPAERVFPTWQVNRFCLMQTLPPESRANGAKARYNSVHTFPLTGTQISDVS